jgi:DNA polymerase-1
VRWAAERITANMPIQGSAADILKVAMINLHGALGIVDDHSASGARMILTVHDELLFEVPKARADEYAAIVRDRMESAASLIVPLTVDVGIGENWKDAKS